MEQHLKCKGEDTSSKDQGIVSSQADQSQYTTTSSGAVDFTNAMENQDPSQRQEEGKAAVGLVSSSRTSSSSSLPDNNTSSKQSENGGSLSNADPGMAQLKDKNGKSERTPLRKGKWTVEEEEYTSRIIHYFNSGLLSLPDGATLRSYLAEKLNCDPMRITKKYAGAACLGRRAQHFRDRAQPLVAEIQLARAELDHLERRFRMRVEEGHSSVPLPPPTDLLQSLANVNRMMVPGANDGSQALFQSWLLGMVGQQQSQPPVPAMPPAPLGVQPSWLLPNAGLGNPLNPVNPVPPTWAPAPAVSNGVDASMANWAFAQAAASLAPAITQLASEHLRQQQQQQQQQQELQQRLKQASTAESVKEYTRQLQQSFEQQLKKSVAPPAPVPSNILPAPTVPSTEVTPTVPASSTQPREASPQPIGSVTQNSNQPSQKPPAARASRKPPKKKPLEDVAVANINIAAAAEKTLASKPVTLQQQQKPRTEEDKQAGSILLGFLSSLRHSYEEALEKEKGALANIGNIPLAMAQSMARASSNGAESEDSAARLVTDSSGMSSSQALVESSVEDSDWNSDKKTDPSSSEDSDKEPQGRTSTSKGPPRKRMKTQRINELGNSKDSN